MNDENAAPRPAHADNARSCGDVEFTKLIGCKYSGDTLQGRPDGNGRFIFSSPGGQTTPQ